MCRGTSLRFAPSDLVSLEQVDVIFLALPHKASATMAKRGIDAGVKVVDLSADLRIDTPEAYERSYHNPHPHPELLPTPYGLPEINRENIAGADVVATPGCYPTTTLLGIYPLLRFKALCARDAHHRRREIGGHRRGTQAVPHYTFCRGLRQPDPIQNGALSSAHRRNGTRGA